jgi:predicted DNA-binding transcriptional regulator AlpA
MHNLKPTPQPRTLDERQAATCIGIAYTTLRQARQRGPRSGRIHAPPHLKLGSRIRYLISDLEAWLLAHRRVSRLPVRGGGEE